MGFKVLTIQYYNQFGVFCTDEINVEGLNPIKIANLMLQWHKKKRLDIEHVELQ